MISRQSIAFVDKNNLLSKNQFGCRKSRSTVNAVMSIVQELLDRKEFKCYVRAKFYGLSNALDKVNRQILLSDVG